MKYYRLYVAGFTGAGCGMYDKLIGTILDKDGKPVYNLDSKGLNLRGEHSMADQAQLLAADGATVTTRQNTFIKNFAQGNRTIYDFDISFLVGDGDDAHAVTSVRINEDAARKLLEALREKLGGQR